MHLILLSGRLTAGDISKVIRVDMSVVQAGLTIMQILPVICQLEYDVAGLGSVLCIRMISSILWLRRESDDPLKPWRLGSTVKCFILMTILPHTNILSTLLHRQMEQTRGCCVCRQTA